MLPQDADEHEDGRDEDEGQRDLADGPRREGLNVHVGAGFGVALFVPPGKGGEEDEGDKGEDNGNDAAEVLVLGRGKGEGQGGGRLHEVRKNNAILERLGDPNQIQGVLIDVYLLGQRRRVIGAQERAAVRVDADAKVAHAHLQHGVADNVGNGGCHAGVHL